MNFSFLQRTFISLNNKNFRRFFIGQSISLIGSWMQQTALMWMVYDKTGSKLLLGITAAVATFPMLFLSAFGGAMADKYKKKKLLIGLQVFSMLLAFVIGFLELNNMLHLWHIMVVVFLIGSIMAIDMPVRQSFYVDIVGKSCLLNAIALNSSMVNAARMIGPAMAGLVMAKFEPAWCFIINGITFIGVLFALTTIEVKESEPANKKEPMLDSVLHGFQYISENKLILNLMLLIAFIVIFGTSYSMLLPAVAKDIFFKGEKGYALMVTCNGIGSLLGALFIAYLGKNLEKRYHLYSGIYLFSLSLLLLAVAQNYWMSLVMLGFAGFGMVSYSATTTSLLQTSVDDSMRGRVMGIWALLFGGLVPVGSLLTGVLAHFIGITETIIFNATVCFMVAMVFSILSIGHRGNEKLKEVRQLVSTYKQFDR